MSSTPPLPDWILDARVKGYANAHRDFPREKRLYGTETLYGDWDAPLLLLAKDFAHSEFLRERMRDGDRHPYRHGESAKTNVMLKKLAGHLVTGDTPTTRGLLYGSALANLLREDGRASGTLPNWTEARTYACRVLHFVIEHMPKLNTIVCMGAEAWDVATQVVHTRPASAKAPRLVRVPHPAARISTARQVEAWRVAGL